MSKADVSKELELLNSDFAPDDPHFKALDHIKITKDVTICISKYKQVQQATRDLNMINKLTVGIPKSKQIKFDKARQDLFVKQYNANTSFNRLYSKLKDYQKIEYALRMHELNPKQ